VTTEINGSTIYCSEDGDENNATMTAITVIHKGMIIEYIVVIRVIIRVQFRLGPEIFIFPSLLNRMITSPALPALW
jgi:hypothetical protein